MVWCYKLQDPPPCLIDCSIDLSIYALEVRYLTARVSQDMLDLQGCSAKIEPRAGQVGEQISEPFRAEFTTRQV